jgi:hypothetical protein
MSGSRDRGSAGGLSRLQASPLKAAGQLGGLHYRSALPVIRTRPGDAVGGDAGQATTSLRDPS